MTGRQQIEMFDTLEPRKLFAFSSYAQLVDQDQATIDYPKINGTGTTVAVIDTGVNYNLSTLGGGLGKKYKVIGGYDFYANDSDPMDESGHGTGVASVIAGNAFTYQGVTYQGVAPSAKLVALRVGTESSISDDNIERALQWVVTNYKAYNISVVNLSLGSGFYADEHTESQLSDEFASLKNLGIFVVAASGNSNDQAQGPIGQDGLAFPSADPSVFAVGAVDSSGILPNWAQRGDELDLLAPGVDIVLPQLNGTYEAEDGTSFSSPYVAGTAALLKQVNPNAKAGDIGSALMSSGTSTRDGDNESGNTTGLLFSQLNVVSAITVMAQRIGKTGTLAMGKTFDTALDSEGVLHAAYYDASNGRLLYATRTIAGLWSSPLVLDKSADVGVQASIAVDMSGKVGIGYFDVTNTSIKYTSFSGTKWSNLTIESDKHIGTYPSLGFTIDGDAYLAYYRRTGGMLRLAHLDRDTGAWDRMTIDGDTTDSGAYVSLDIGEAAIQSNGGFTVYDTTVAMAYVSDGDLKYARKDLDNSAATWFLSTVDDLNGVANIDFNLHNGPLNLGLQAQIAYENTTTKEVKYAYRANNAWSSETIAGVGRIAGQAQLAFDDSNDPIITFYHGVKRVVYSATRISSTNWSLARVGLGSGNMAVGQNDRDDTVLLSFLNKARTDLVSSVL